MMMAQEEFSRRGTETQSDVPLCGSVPPCEPSSADAKIENYRAFLRAKVRLAESDGFEVDPREVNPALKDFVREAIVPWAARGGRRAIFSAFGLHKTSTQIELARLGLKIKQAVPMIVLPLGVRQEFFEEAEIRFTGDFAVKMRFIRSTREACEHSINLTNYETAREGKIDARQFGLVSLDEGAVLRGFGGTKTFRTFMAEFAGDDRRPSTGSGRGESDDLTLSLSKGGTKYRFVATATPDPNEYIELLAYAAFLGIMDVGEAKTRFFKRDSTQADKLTIHPHKEREFWLWVASWALFVRRPSDLGFSDEGYSLPKLDVRWHEVPSDHSKAGAERDGQARMFANAAHGVSESAQEKRNSLGARVEKMLALRAEDPDAHRILWHDLEAEREAIEKAVPRVHAIFGSQDILKNEKIALDFKHGRIAELATKPSMSGAGCNFQAFCAWAIFLGIGHKFHDFIQAVHRLQRFGQMRDVRIDMIYSEGERETRRNLEVKWARHDAQAEIMSQLIREYGLSQAAMAKSLARSMGTQRAEACGERWRMVNNDSVEECAGAAENSVDLIVTSIPFSTQYEYTPSFNDFGHTDDDAHFWEQMDFLIPDLLRMLRPGRVAVIHVKDRVVPGGINGLGFQTLTPFSDDCVARFRRRGFAFMARRTICTDVVRENNQTYRLGWSEVCKDATKIGAGQPEYLLLFRKPTSDAATSYADARVGKDKPLCDDHGAPAPFDKQTNFKQPVPATGYSRARWQIDAHGFWRSSGNRLIGTDEVAALLKQPRETRFKALYRAWRARSTAAPYDYAGHVATVEELDYARSLPSSFMLLPTHSDHPDVWSDVARMRTLNMLQAQKGREMHLCPLQLDIVDRAIELYSMPGETVFDPFAGIGTVPCCALKLGRRGFGIELSPRYYRDALHYCEAASQADASPTFFDMLAGDDVALPDEAAE
ncbi:MAG TPA: DNA methyltransferase [Rhizomicrobium sp.]|jgi:DNA modification methylase|nr:DNA methyltransferase [Rhizomicrobium sp.]